MKNTNKNIDQLELEFNKRRVDLKDAVDQFAKAAGQLSEASTNSPEEQDMVTDEIKEMRQNIKRLVGILSDQSGLSFHSTWVLAYHEHSMRTGYHAVAASGGKGTHLDAAQRDGQLSELRETMVGMLNKSEFAPRGMKL